MNGGIGLKPSRVAQERRAVTDAIALGKFCLWIAALYLIYKLLTLTLLAQPEIIRLSYGPPLPQIEGVSYCATNAAPIFVEFPDQTTPDGLISETVSIGVTATISLTFSNVTPGNIYAVYSCTNLVFPRGEFGAWPTNCTNCFAPPPTEPATWIRSSLWLTPSGQTLSWTQSFGDGQRFFKIIER